MTLESQVSNLELSQKLKELGEKQESLWYWAFHPAPKEKKPRQELHLGDKEIKHWVDWNYFSAFTVAELLSLIGGEPILVPTDGTAPDYLAKILIQKYA